MSSACSGPKFRLGLDQKNHCRILESLDIYSGIFDFFLLKGAFSYHITNCFSYFFMFKRFIMQHWERTAAVQGRTGPIFLGHMEYLTQLFGFNSYSVKVCRPRDATSSHLVSGNTTGSQLDEARSHSDFTSGLDRLTQTSFPALMKLQ